MFSRLSLLLFSAKFSKRRQPVSVLVVPLGAAAVESHLKPAPRAAAAVTASFPDSGAAGDALDDSPARPCLVAAAIRRQQRGVPVPIHSTAAQASEPVRRARAGISKRIPSSGRRSVDFGADDSDRGHGAQHVRFAGQQRPGESTERGRWSKISKRLCDQVVIVECLVLELLWVVNSQTISAKFFKRPTL